MLYGLTLQANIPIPGLLPDLNTREADVCVHLKEAPGFPQLNSSSLSEPVYTSPTDDGDVTLRVEKCNDSACFLFSYGDGARFMVDRVGREIWADWPRDYTLEDAATYLVGPVIGLVLRLRGMLPLHASAVAIGDRAIALMGAAGAGKSTTAAGFATLGYAVLADDLAALREVDRNFLVQSGYPRVNLWLDSAQALFGSEKPLPNISPSWDKRFVPLGDEKMQFEQRELPLGSIYILGDRDAKLSEPAIEPLDGPSALVKLAANTYVNYLLDAEMRQHEFGVLSRLLGDIPVHLVRPPANPAHLRSMCEAIATDARKLTAPPSISAESRRG